MAKHLTRRQLQLAELVAQGLGNKQIAYQLGLTNGTVKEYLHTIFRKLAITNRVELTIHVLTSKKN